jgi:hypothetical protein
MELKTPKKYVIKAIDDLSNVSYIHVDGEKVSCTLSNGTPASLFYAGFSCDVEAVRIWLARTRDVREGLLLCRRLSPRYTYEEF